MLVEVLPHFGHPLAHQTPEFELPHAEPGLNGLAQADLVRQEITHAVARYRLGERSDLMRQRDDRRFGWAQAGRPGSGRRLLAPQRRDRSSDEC